MDCNNCANRLLQVCASCFPKSPKFLAKEIPEKEERKVYSIIPDTENENIRVMRFEKVMSYTEIAQKYGVAHGTIERFVNKNFTRDGKLKQKKEHGGIDIERAAHLYNGGLTIEETALALKVAESTLRLAMKDNGVELRPRGSVPNEGIRQIKI